MTETEKDQRQDILHSVQQILRDILHQPALQVNETTTSDQVDKWDSLAHVNILMTIERQFGIRFSLGEIKQLRNVGEMINLIAEKTG